MKKLSVFALLLVLCLCLCACRESEKPGETADIPNIDHNILDADRHLGNSYENYSSEDTLLVEYGNRIYHAYNSRHEIMEYCTANDKEKPLGIYGTNLSVYKNVLYYIAEDGLSIHAFDLATGIDSVWITGEEVATLLPEPTYQYPRISDLVVTDYGMCMLYGSSEKYLTILSTNRNCEYFRPKDYLETAKLIPISRDKICIADPLNRNFTIMNISSKDLFHLDPDLDIPSSYIRFGGNDSLFYYDISDLYLKHYDLTTQTIKKIDYVIDLPYYNCVYAFFDNSVFYNTTNDYNKTVSFWILPLAEGLPRKTDLPLAIYNLSITSGKTIYGIAYDPYDFTEYKYFKTDFDFTKIIWL